nr:TRIC cation channel family protein [Prauserella isguenensis]
MATAPPLLLALDFTGTFAFALNGALTAVRAARLDIVGVVTLGVITALGGGIMRDVLIGAVPPTAFREWPYLATAGGGGLAAFALSQWLDRLETPINVLDAVGLSTFAVIGASTALEAGLDVTPAILLGGVTAVGGGTIRDTLGPPGAVGVAERSVRHPCPPRRRGHGRHDPGGRLRRVGGAGGRRRVLHGPHGRCPLRSAGTGPAGPPRRARLTDEPSDRGRLHSPGWVSLRGTANTRSTYSDPGSAVSSRGSATSTRPRR